MAEEIDLSPAEEAALGRAWARVGPLLAPGAAPFAWDESKHPRGQPGNAGEFGPGGGGTTPALPGPSAAGTRWRKVGSPRAWGKENFGAWADGLSAEEKKSVSAYKEDSAIVNESLRDRGYVHNPGHAAVSRQITRALARASVPHDVVAYRGAPREFYEHLNEGDTFKDRGFVSTTVNRRTADTFKDVHETGNPTVLITVLVPKGSMGAYVDTFDNAFGDELLLQRGSRFRVLKKKGGALLVKLLPRKRRDG